MEKSRDNFQNLIQETCGEVWGFKTDIKCHFYYDESNNCRKFGIKFKNDLIDFNVDPYEDFVLAGVATLKDIDVSFEELRDLLHLQNNVAEIKFKKHFSNGNFLNTMNKKRVSNLLKWIKRNQLFIHFTHVNNFYYTLVEIIDSIMDIKYITNSGFNYFKIKSVFYDMFFGKEKFMLKIMYKYKYPNIQKDDIADFLSEIINLFGEKERLNIEQKFIVESLENARRAKELVFLHNNTDYIMQEGYNEFYFDHPLKYYNSFHTFDEETFIQSNSIQQFLGIELNNIEYVNSKDSVLVQVSDVIAGIFGKLMIYVNKSDKKTIFNDVQKLTITQIENINLLHYLLNQAKSFNNGFLMSVSDVSVLERVEYLFKLCQNRY